MKPISVEELGHLGVDRKGGLYWDGKRVETRQRIGLTVWQKLGAMLTVASAVVMAAFTVLAYFWPPN